MGHSSMMLGVLVEVVLRAMVPDIVGQGSSMPCSKKLLRKEWRDQTGEQQKLIEKIHRGRIVRWPSSTVSPVHDHSAIATMAFQQRR